MRTSIRTLLISAAAIISCAACLPAAAAHDGQTRVMTFQLPDGSIEQIRYTGDVAPQIMVTPAARPSLMPMPAFDPGFADPGFAAIDRAFAALDRQADAMLRQAADLPRLAPADLRALPAGVSGYSVVTTFSSSGACTRSTQVSYAGSGVSPRTVSSTSGNCGPAHGAAPFTTQVRAPVDTPYGGLVTPAVWEH